MELRLRSLGQAGGSQRVWSLAYLDVTATEGRKLLTEDQYAHLVQQFEALSCEEDPRRSRTQDIRQIEDFWELREKGGLLGRMNVRVYFTVLESERLILVLKVYKKEEEGQTPGYVKIAVRNRLRTALRLLAEDQRGTDGERRGKG
ncbi:MAG: hypothetical protein IT449_04115 [Phycisphaerales bacterium]|nr:hypothetical protein [Phycisphaerales bacterium]